MSVDKLKTAITDLPWTELRRAFVDLQQGGKGRREAASIVAELVDHAVDFEALLPGVVGQVLEAGDRSCIRAAIVLGLLFASRGA